MLFIVIDWSSIVAHQQHLLRASIILKGRCITVYEEIYPESALNTGESHQNFLRNLKWVLPENRDICIIIDAEFRTDFFIQVQTESWDYVGRILSTMHYTLREKDDWKPCTSLYAQATSQPEAIIGLCLEKKGLHRDFQANSIKHKRVLSLIFLALEAIRRGYMRFISELDFRDLRQDGLDDEILSVQISQGSLSPNPLPHATRGGEGITRKICNNAGQAAGRRRRG